MSDKINNIVEQIKGLNTSDRWELLETLERELSGDTVLIFTDRESVINHTGLYELSNLPETQQNEMMREIGDALNEFVNGLYLSTVKSVTTDYIKK